jgi:hypothetical protein
MIDNSGTWIARAEALLASGRIGSPHKAGEAVQFATSMLTALYGSESPQLRAFRARQREATHAIHSGRQVMSTRTGISFLIGIAKSDGGSILKSDSIAGIVPVIRVSFP